MLGDVIEYLLIRERLLVVNDGVEKLAISVTTTVPVRSIASVVRAHTYSQV